MLVYLIRSVSGIAYQTGIKEITMTELICEVCGKEAVQVVASRFGAVSNAYCPECLGKGIEPYSNAISLLFCVPYPELWDEYKEIVFRSVVAAGHTMRDAAIEVTRLDRQYEEYCKRIQAKQAEYTCKHDCTVTCSVGQSSCTSDCPVYWEHNGDDCPVMETESAFWSSEFILDDYMSHYCP
jgi:hypothetical protein